VQCLRSLPQTPRQTTSDKPQNRRDQESKPRKEFWCCAECKEESRLRFFFFRCRVIDSRSACVPGPIVGVTNRSTRVSSIPMCSTKPDRRMGHHHLAPSAIVARPRSLPMAIPTAPTPRSRGQRPLRCTQATCHPSTATLSTITTRITLLHSHRCTFDSRRRDALPHR
jgi:hypothetical protein